MIDPYESGEVPMPAHGFEIDGAQELLRKLQSDAQSEMNELKLHEKGNTASAFMWEVAYTVLPILPDETPEREQLRDAMVVAPKVILKSFRQSSSISAEDRMDVLRTFENADVPEGFYEADEDARLDSLRLLGDLGFVDHPETAKLAAEVLRYYAEELDELYEGDLELIIGSMGFALLRLDTAWAALKDQPGKKRPETTQESDGAEEHETRPDMPYGAHVRRALKCFFHQQVTGDRSWRQWPPNR